MKRHFPGALALVVGLAIPASADEFTPGHIFVGGYDTVSAGIVSEFDADLGFVRHIDLSDGDGGSEIYGVAFGPDGMLYAAQIADGRVERVAPDGTFTAFIDDGEGLDRAALLSFGPLGRLHVGSRGTNQLLRRETGGALTALALPGEIVGPDAISFLPSGRRVVSHQQGDDAARVIDAYGRASLQLDQTTTVVGYPADVVEARDGTIVVPDYSGDQVLLTHPDGRDSVSVTHPDLAGPFGIALLDNGNYVVAGFDSANLVEFTPSGTYVRTVALVGAEFPAQIAVAPYAFDVKLTGAVADVGRAIRKTKGKRVRVSVEMAGGTVMVLIPDNPTRTDDAADVLGTSFVLRGHISKRSGDRTRRYVHATLPGDSAEEGRGSVALEIKGSEGPGGRFTPKKLKGTWHFSRGNTTFAGTVSGNVAKPE